MIQIQDLQDLDLEEVVNLLLEEKTDTFEIYIPKSTKEFFSDREAIVDDYATLAYCGQMLLDVSKEFDYDEVAPHEHESVCFTIKVDNFEQLADTLLKISYGFVNNHPEDEEFSLLELASDYLYKVENGQVSVIACPYFIEVCQEFEDEEEYEEDEEENP